MSATISKIEQAIDDVRRLLAIRKDRCGGRLQYSDRIIESILPIVEKAKLVVDRDLIASKTIVDDHPTEGTAEAMEELLEALDGLRDGVVATEAQLAEVIR